MPKNMSEHTSGLDGRTNARKDAKTLLSTILDDVSKKHTQVDARASLRRVSAIARVGQCFSVPQCRANESLTWPSVNPRNTRTIA